MTFEEIAKRVGVSRAAAWQLWNRHLMKRRMGAIAQEQLDLAALGSERKGRPEERPM